jgi:hypothetical protein
MKFVIVALLMSASALDLALADTHYVSMSGSNTSPYTSWATAARALDSAITQSSNGDTVLVSNGVYTLSSQISLTKGVAVSSLSGPSETVIDGNNVTRCVFMSHASASLAGFTIRNGYGLNLMGGGVHIDGDEVTGGGTLERCVIRDNRVHASSSGANVAGGGVFLSTRGTVRNCLIMNNTAETAGGKSANGGGLYLSHGGTVESCTIVGNSAKTSGGYYVLFYGTLRNCIAYYNVKTDGTASNGGYEFFPLETTGVYFNYCCSTPVLSGTGNTASAPLFVDPATQDYRLSASSPCIDTGTSSGAPAVDLDGVPRPLEGNGSGGAGFDIGAYEYAQPVVVNFNAQGGAVNPASATVTNSLAYGALPVPLLAGNAFGGWWTAAGGSGSRVYGSTLVNTGSSHTLYAKWLASTSQGTSTQWLYGFGLVTAGNYEAAALADADGDGHAAWQEYVAGTVPTNSESALRALIAVSNGMPWIAWTPDLGTARVYAVEGSTDLTGSAWGPTNAGCRFYRVKVGMP